VADRTDPSDWPGLISAALDAANGADDVESALSVLTDLAKCALGDQAAAERPDALLEGEQDYNVAGIFLISPDRQHNVLVASQGFPPEQRRLSIPIEWNHPGRVVATERMLLLENTDEHEDFRQFLRTSRMGSSIYMPFFGATEMAGQLVAAAQARWTYAPEDIAPMSTLAAVAGLIWSTRDGATWWQNDHPAPDAWYAEKQRI